jgi:hypothetical protein
MAEEIFRLSAKEALKLMTEARATVNVDHHLTELYKDIEEAAGLGYDEITTARIAEASADGRHQYIIEAMVGSLQKAGYRVNNRSGTSYTIMWG